MVVVEPSSTHYYQPMWTLVGGGIFKNTRTARPEADVIPSGVQWRQDRCVYTSVIFNHNIGIISYVWYASLIQIDTHANDAHVVSGVSPAE